MNNPNYYLAIGSYTNWLTAFSNANIWGLGENRYRTWARLSLGDILFFYTETPISAVVGYGAVSAKFHSMAPFFAEDLGTSSEWPWRIRFDLFAPLGNPLHVGMRVGIEDFKKDITLHRGFRDSLTQRL